MIALLEVPAIRQRVARLSVEDYHRLGERPVELLRGNIIEKMSKSPSHQFHADRLRKILSAQISPDWMVRQEGPLTFADSEPEPDVAVVRGPEELYRTAHPATAALVVEIALSSLEVDRVKADIYADAGVAEYWIVCPDEKRVEVYRQPGANGYAEYTVITPPAEIECVALPGVRLHLAAIFA
jgi:Uma2 family endonuclease